MIFDLELEIKSKKGELHFRRWRLIKTRWFDVYIHGIYKADTDKYLHDHPWDIWTMVLWGSYLEELPDKRYNYRSCFNMGYRRDKKFHKVRTCFGPTYTLAIMGKEKREWGYDVEGVWVHNEEYRRLKREKKI